MRRLLFFLLLPLISQAQVDREKKALDQMLSSCEKLRSASFILSTAERIKNGTVETGEMLVKLQHNPLRLYLHIYKPDAGVEILYRKGEWNDHILINPNGFPYVNLKMDMNHQKVRKNAHHTVADIGFDYLTNMIRHYRSVFGDRLFDYLQITDTVKFELHRCMKMEFDYPDFAYVDYIVQEGEDVVGIAAKNHVHEYMIITANPDVENVHDVKAGQRIRIPNMFARKITFYVDLQSWLPLVQEINDEKGFFEKYEYKSFVLNPEFNPAEFTPDYNDYGF